MYEMMNKRIKTYGKLPPWMREKLRLQKRKGAIKSRE